MKKIFSSILFTLVSLITLSAYNITGTITDDQGEPLPEAGVRLLTARDSSYVKGCAADIDGKFSLQGVANGRYIIELSYIGYNPHRQQIRIRDNSQNLGQIKLSESSIMLKEAVVTGVKTPVKVMEDTVEFNADSYTTQPNAVVEDLLKRLPGVEVDTDGKITHNGKEITKILVDGKEFFSDDPKVASKNLPVEMIDKLQVVDRKSDLARITGVDDGEDETVINLTVKKGMKNGWFGTAEAGYGTDSRYKATFNVNRFWNDNQITFIGNANNTNELGFSDGNGNRFRRFGGDNGVNNSQQFGVNFNVGNAEIFRVGGDVMYSHTDRRTTKRSERIYNFADSMPTQSGLSDAKDKGHNIRADFRVQWNPDSFNTMEFRPNISYNVNDSWANDETWNRAGNATSDLVTQSRNLGNSHGKSFEFGGNAVYSHKFRNHPGRSFSVQLRYQLSNVRENENSYSWNKFFMLDSLYLTDQYLDNHTWSNTVQTRVTWTEPLGDAKNGNFLTFAYRVQYRWNNSDKNVFDHPVVYDPLGIDEPFIDYSTALFNDTLSNQFRNDYFNQTIRLGYKKVTKRYNLDAGMSLVPQRSESRDLIRAERSIPTRWVWNYAPFLRLNVKFSKTSSLNMNYMGRSSKPTMSQLQPVADYTDPLKVIQGNPDLDPTFSHNVRLRFQNFNHESQRSVMLMFDGSVVQNSIVSRTVFNPETSGQITTYENVNGVWNARIMNMVSMPFGSRKTWRFSNMIFGMANQNIGFNNGQRNTARNIMFSESFGIAFRPQNLELELRPNYRLQYLTNSVSTAGNSTVHNYGGMFNGTYYTPFGLVLATDLNYNATSGYSNGYDTRSLLWNASIAYQFLKGKAATFAVKAYDLLQQRSSVRRITGGNYTEDVEYNTLGRYVMFSLTYRFNTFGKGNEPASRNNRRWGPGPGGPGGHR